MAREATSFRFDEGTRATLARLATRVGCAQVQVVRRAIELLAGNEGALEQLASDAAASAKLDGRQVMKRRSR